MGVDVSVGVTVTADAHEAMKKAINNAESIVFVFMILSCKELPNGMRYLRVGGTRQRRFAGTDSQPHKLLENAATPTRRVHAVLGRLCAYQDASRKEVTHG